MGESPTLTTLVTPGYAPFEQYQDERHSSKQGPWSDIYSLGATLYRVISGDGPVDALTRVNSKLDGTPDPLKPAREVGADSYSARFLDAVDAALRFDVQDRPPDVAHWRRMFPEGGRLPDMHGVSDASLAWAEWESRKSAKSSGALTGLRGEKPAGPRAPPRALRYGVVAVVALGVVIGGYLALNGSVAERPPIVKIVASPPTSARDDRIGELLRAAAEDVEALRLTTPAGDNAFERYQQVLTLEPGNEDALRGLEVIVIRYVTLANTAISKGELEKAHSYLDSAALVEPDDEGIALARKMLSAAEASSPAVDAPGTPVTGSLSPPAATTPRRVAVLPFWGRQSATATEEGPGVSVTISEFAHNFLRGRSSLDMIYSYYQPGFDHAAVKAAGALWSGDAVSKVPQMGALRELGRELGADGVLVYGFEPKLGSGAEIRAYLIDVGDGRIIRREGDLESLAKITRDAFEYWTGGND